MESFEPLFIIINLSLHFCASNFCQKFPGSSNTQSTPPSYGLAFYAFFPMPVSSTVSRHWRQLMSTTDDAYCVCVVVVLHVLSALETGSLTSFAAGESMSACLVLLLLNFSSCSCCLIWPLAESFLCLSDSVCCGGCGNISLWRKLRIWSHDNMQICRYVLLEWFEYSYYILCES